jgi:hypothetical protein
MGAENGWRPPASQNRTFCTDAGRKCSLWTSRRRTRQTPSKCEPENNPQQVTPDFITLCHACVATARRGFVWPRNFLHAIVHSTKAITQRGTRENPRCDRRESPRRTKMARNATTLDVLRDLYNLVVLVTEGRHENLALLEANEVYGAVFEAELAKVWKRPERKEASRAQVNSGTGGLALSILPSPSADAPM